MMHLTFYGLSLIDIAVIVIYFAVIFIIAIGVARRVKSREDFFMGGRRFGKLIQTFAAFGMATSVENVTTSTTMVYANGASGIWAGLASGLLNLPIFWMTSPWYRRLRLLTMGDFFEERYGSKRMAAFYAMCQIIFFTIIAAFGLMAMSKTVCAITTKPESAMTVTERVECGKALERQKLEAADYSMLSTEEKGRLSRLQLESPQEECSYLNEKWLICGVALVVFVYVSIGGLAAAFLIDLLQGVCILVLSILLIPFAVLKINHIHGGAGLVSALGTVHKVLPASFLEMWGSPNLIEFTWYWIAAFSIMVVLTTAVQASQMTACGSAKDDYTARYGFVAGVLLKRYSSVLWGTVALLTLVLYGGTISDPDYVWGHATRDLLGPAGIGLVGLMVACLIAALMAAKSAYMLTASALVTNNFYRPFRPNMSEKHYVIMGRVFGALYILISVICAMQFNGLFGLFKMTMMFNAILAAAFWLGMLWRRANAKGAWASMILMFVFTVILPFGLPLIPGVRNSAYLCKTTHPTVVKRTYTARQIDVEEREAAAARWVPLSLAGETKAPRPAPLRVGEKFEKEVLLPPKAIFWSDDIQYREGKATGRGNLKVELVCLDWLGWDLSKNPYSLNETLTFLFRIVCPFGIMVLVSAFTRPEGKERLDQFYGKMRTPVVGTLAEDGEEMELTRANPHRFDHLRLFPKSNWEFRKWNREDWTGVCGTCVAAVSVVALLMLIIGLGS
jgi:SSS family solute:Na+ symporter